MTSADPAPGRPAGPPVATATGLCKQYPGVRALDSVDFTIHRGEVRALLGRNGAGKSTLIRLLSGVETPDAGEVVIGGEPLGDGGVRRAAELGVATVYQELSLVPEMTVAENLFLNAWPRRGAAGIDYPRMRREAAEVLGELEVPVDPDALVGTLPLAEQQLLEIARAVRRRPRLLILDEPTSALAAEEAHTVLSAVRRIADSGVAVIYVSHRLDEIRQVAGSVTVVRDGQVIDTVDVHDATTAQIVALMLGTTVQEAAALEPRTVERTRTPLLSVRGLTLPPKLHGVDVDLYAGEVLGIGGLLGSGRSELLRAIAGFEPRAERVIEVDGVRVARPTAAAMKKLGLGMTPEDRKGAGIVPMLGVGENMTMSWFGGVSRRGSISPALAERAGYDLVERLSVKTPRLSTPIVNLSGGNQQKAVIGRWLHARSRILLLDEPTRGVDVEAKQQIYRLVRELAGNGAAVVFVSGELEELPLVCDRVVTLQQGRIHREFTAPDITLDNIMAATMAVEV
ncbi:sugar ABC transporter ATP-binding protein [Streptomyces botrytidirepellens]|uniref:Sugar ABC transporter ATP-binding protein n=1 Tax=Streptomyces botrytidirepellens TaxID=2486417 RepID=A0A3M8WJS1_9ACTN|nr:sugar ABC transporter ATP-binding protein [Streptomyces botrytidirepellens]RNG28203.1 sugar ABC transporter ATP-binding protein [Streptomyces botrytidirepellens]